MALSLNQVIAISFTIKNTKPNSQLGHFIPADSHLHIHKFSSPQPTLLSHSGYIFPFSRRNP